GKLGINGATVRKTKSGYEVKRTLLKGPHKWGDSFKLVDVIENVGHDGSYDCKIGKERDIPEVKGIQLRFSTADA
ncbi:MAG: hypothetical protein NT018_07965, partial [Armatimonadetes bacterium]|nr:hypothetical protein [Armatimonadota bacterium]